MSYPGYSSQMECGYGIDGTRAWTESTWDGSNYLLYDGDDFIGAAPMSNGALYSYNTYGVNGVVSNTNSSPFTCWYDYDALGNEQYQDNGGGWYSWPTYNDVYGYVEGNSTATGASGLDGGAVSSAGTYNLNTGFVNQDGIFFDGAEVLAGHPFFVMGARDYYPTTGRFLNRDPIGYAGGTNLYAYTDDDPVGWADADGTNSTAIGEGVVVGGVIGGIIGGAIGGGVYGTTIGTVVPGPGNILGAGIGIVVGGIAGGLYGAGISGGFGGFNPGIELPGTRTSPHIPPHRTSCPINTSANQLQQQVQRGQAPGTIDRVDRSLNGNPEKDEVHFGPRGEDGALYRDGTWRHPLGRELTNREKDWLNRGGFTLPE